MKQLLTGLRRRIPDPARRWWGKLKGRLGFFSDQVSPYRRTAGSTAVTFPRPAPAPSPDAIAVVVLTNCARRALLTQAVHSADAMLKGPIARRVIADDSRDPEAHAWLQREFPNWEVVETPPRPFSFRKADKKGFCAAWAGAIEVGRAAGPPWLFWLEDDFVFNQVVDLSDLQAVMNRNPKLYQLSLKRQPWYPHEIAVGGIIEVAPDQYTQRDGWIAHRRHWTTNPNLTRRSLYEAHPWSRPPSCELRFGWSLLTDPEVVFGIWGVIGDDPWVTHLGEQSAGAGY